LRILSDLQITAIFCIQISFPTQFVRNAGDLPPSVHIQKDLVFWDFIPPDSQIEELVVIYRALEILLDEINQSNNQRVIRYTIEVHGEQEKVTLAANWEDAVQVLQLPDCRNDKEELKRQLDELIYTAETPAQKQQIQEKLESYLQKRLSDFRRQGAEKIIPDIYEKEILFVNSVPLID